MITEERKQELWAQYQAAIHEGTAGALWDELAANERAFILSRQIEIVVQAVQAIIQPIIEWFEEVFVPVIKSVWDRIKYWYRTVTNRTYRVPANICQRAVHAPSYPLVRWYPALE